MGAPGSTFAVLGSASSWDSAAIRRRATLKGVGRVLRRRAAFLVIGAALALAGSLAASPRAHAIDPTIRSIIVGGMYGIVAGTALGLISYPMTGSVRGIFMGTSIGMYLGAVAGGDSVAPKDDPYNPL